jgi:hypothetical protein
MSLFGTLARLAPTSGEKLACAPDRSPANRMEVLMQSTQGQRYTSMNEIASAAKQREGLRATLQEAIAAWTAPGVLFLLFLASLAYVVFGGALALDASPAPEPDTAIAEGAVITADTGRDPGNEEAVRRFAQASDRLPARSANEGRDVSRNVMTHEHD